MRFFSAFLLVFTFLLTQPFECRAQCLGWLVEIANDEKELAGRWPQILRAFGLDPVQAEEDPIPMAEGSLIYPVMGLKASAYALQGIEGVKIYPSSDFTLTAEQPPIVWGPAEKSTLTSELVDWLEADRTGERRVLISFEDSDVGRKTWQGFSQYLADAGVPHPERNYVSKRRPIAAATVTAANLTEMLKLSGIKKIFQDVPIELHSPPQL